jgi:DNA-directed RNA polymerase specialized sigma24 family protein
MSGSVSLETIDRPTIEAAQLDAANDDFVTVHRDTFEGDLVACRLALRRTARRLFRNPDDADDAVQSVFLRALERRDQFLGGCMECWLHRILTNVFCDKARERKRLVFTGDPTYADHLPDQADTHASFEAHETPVIA